MNIAEKHFLFFEGNWSLRRFINGHGEMKGLASFHPLRGLLPSYAYYEKGIFLNSDRTESDFFREYIYCLNHGKVEVYFSFRKKRKNLFHTLEFTSQQKAFATHLCNKDSYKATYIFLNQNAFILEYKVRGPKKAFKIETFFRRISDSSSF